MSYSFIIALFISTLFSNPVFAGEMKCEAIVNQALSQLRLGTVWKPTGDKTAQDQYGCTVFSSAEKTRMFRTRVTACESQKNSTHAYTMTTFAEGATSSVTVGYDSNTCKAQEMVCAQVAQGVGKSRAVRVEASQCLAYYKTGAANFTNSFTKEKVDAKSCLLETTNFCDSYKSFIEPLSAGVDRNDVVNQIKAKIGK